MTDYASYAAEMRHRIHQYPEIGFDLPKTLALVRQELTAMGIGYTEKYGRSSIVGTINPEKTGFTIGIRADMDALPVQEESNNPYKSQNPGAMHACGHDVHTAILLGTARKLQDIRDQINCRVKLLFTPAEEYIQPGCKEMAEDGVMDDIDCIVALHVNPDFDAGTVGITSGGQGGNSMGFTAEFFGKTAHAAGQHKGNDAIAMAVQAYVAMEQMVSHELPAIEPRMLNIGAFNGGHTNNVICDYCKLFGSARSYSDEVSALMERRIREICEGVAAMNGGRAVVTVTKFLPYVDNHEVVTQRMHLAAEKVLGPENIKANKRSLGGEDFSFLCRRKPGMMFRLGTRGENPDTHCPIHNSHFDVDERCFDVGIRVFTQFVLDNMDGIAF